MIDNLIKTKSIAYSVLVALAFTILETSIFRFLYLYPDYFSSFSNWIIVFTQTFLMWFSVILAIIFFKQLASKIHIKTIKLIFNIIYFLCIGLFAATYIFVWQYASKAGNIPAAHILLFLLDNLYLSFLHIFSTSYVKAIGLLAVSSFIVVASNIFVNRVINRNEISHKMSLFFHFSIIFVAILINSIIPLKVATPISFLSSHRLQDHYTVEQKPLNLTKKEDLFKTTRNPDNNYNVIFVLIESFRRDLYYEQSAAIPNLKKIGINSIFFDKAYATATHSDLADLAFWYSQYPLRHSKRILNRYPKDASWRGDSIFKVFKESGYQTAYVSSQNEKWANMINWLDMPEVDYFYHSENYDGKTWAKDDPANGLIPMLTKGITNSGKLEDAITLKVASDWIIKNKDKPFMIGLNLQNTHFSYFIPENAEQPFQPSESKMLGMYASWPKEKAKLVRNRYLNSVYNLDKAIGEFYKVLKKENIWDNTIFVLVGDSGEAFYEHGFANHSGPNYDEVARSFAILKPPAELSGKYSHIHQKAISHIDLIPGVLDILGIKPSQTFQGISPFSESKEERPIFLMAHQFYIQRGILLWPYKLMETIGRKNTYYELYNLEKDPDEKHNIASNTDEISKKLYLALQAWKTAQTSYYDDSKNYSYYYPPKYTSMEAMKKIVVK